jgi:hypothetical protein
MNTMKPDRLNYDTLPDALMDSLPSGTQDTALETHLQALQEQLADATAEDRLELQLQIARALVELERSDQAWSLARSLFDQAIGEDRWEEAADACEIMAHTNHEQALAALGQGIWLAVTFPIDVELSIELLNHVVEDTPDDSDGAAVAATTALFLADIRAEGKERENLMFFCSQILGNVARKHSEVKTQEQFDHWMERLELKEPDKFLVRLRNVIDVLIQDNWWFDKEQLQQRLFSH